VEGCSQCAAKVSAFEQSKAIKSLLGYEKCIKTLAPLAPSNTRRMTFAVQGLLSNVVALWDGHGHLLLLVHEIDLDGRNDENDENIRKW